MTDKHTSGQLKARMFRDGSVALEHEDGSLICEVRAKSDAHRLVQCWNAHDDLVEALEDADAVLLIADRSRAWQEERERVRARVRQALTKAKASGGGE